MLQLMFVENGRATAVPLDVVTAEGPQRVKVLKGGRYAVAIPVEGEPLVNFPPGYLVKRGGSDLILTKDGESLLVLEGFFAQQPVPEFRLEYDDELWLVSAENLEAYPSEGTLFASAVMHNDADAERAAAPTEKDNGVAAWLLGLAAGAGLGAASLSGGGGGGGNRGAILPDPDDRLQPNLLAPAVAEMDGGAINAAEAADGTSVQIPGYAGMRAGDTIALNWNGVVLRHVVTTEDVATGHVQFQVSAELLGADSTFNVDYIVSNSSGAMLGKSLATPVVIDRAGPGEPGTGVDRPDTEVNENLSAPIVDEMADGKINGAEAADGTLVRIPGYPNMEVGDTVRLNWNGRLIEHTVGHADVGRHEVRIQIPPDRLGEDGGFSVDYTVLDRSGNASGISPGTRVELDRVIPGSPGGGVDEPSTPVNENLAAPLLDEMSGGLINAAEALDGTVVRIRAYANMAAGDTIQLNWNGVPVTHEVSAADLALGEVRIHVPTERLVDGAFQLDYTVTDRHGNASGLSPSTPVVIDRTAPGAPGTGGDVPLTPINENLAAPLVDEMSGGAINAAEAADGTLVRIPRYLNMEAGDVIRLNWNGTAIDHLVTPSDVAAGEVHIPIAPALLPLGNFTIDYVVTDRNGNSSGVSPGTPIVIAQFAPPTIESIDDDTGVAGDRITHDNTLTIQGSADSGALVVVMADGLPIGSAVADAWGHWTLTTPPLTDGDREITARQINVFGTVSPESPRYSIQIDTQVAPPTIDVVGADTGIPGDGITADRSLEIVGRAEAGAVVQVYIDGVSIGTTIANESGQWTFLATVETDGVKAITAVQIDVAGNVSSASAQYTITVDTSALPPTIESVGSDTGVVGDRLTGDNTLEIRGKAESGAAVSILINGMVVGTVVAGVDGRWTFTTSPLADGVKSITAKQTDPAGNVSGYAPPYVMIIDTAPVASSGLLAPVIAEMADGKIDASEAADGVTVRIPAYADMSEGDTVTLRWNGVTFVHSVTAADMAAGEVVITVPRASVANGSFTVDYTVADPAGNVSNPSPGTPVIVNVLPPPPNNQPVNDSAGGGRNSEVTLLPNGGWITTWETVVRNPSTGDVYFQLYQRRFDANGYATGPGTLVDTSGPGGSGVQTHELVTLPNGGWAHVYVTTPTHGNYTAYIQRYTESGVKDGPRILLGTRDSHHIEALSNGDLIVTSDGCLTRIDASGNQVWQTSGAYFWGTFELLDEGGVVFAGKSSGSDHVALKFVNADGTANGAETVVSWGSMNPAYVPQIERLRDGGYVVVWVEGTTLYQRQYRANGEPAGDPVLIRANRCVSDVVPTSDGGWVIASTDANSKLVYLQRFNALGVAVGNEVLVGSHADGVTAGEMTVMADGGYLVTWGAKVALGNEGWSVFQQRYDAAGNKVALDGSPLATFQTMEPAPWADDPEAPGIAPADDQDSTGRVAAVEPAELVPSVASRDALRVEQLLGELADVQSALQFDAAWQSARAPLVATERTVEPGLTGPLMPVADLEENWVTEAMPAPDAHALEGLLDGVIGELTQVMHSAKPVCSGPLLVVPTRFDGGELDDGFAMHS